MAYPRLFSGGNKKRQRAEEKQAGTKRSKRQQVCLCLAYQPSISIFHIQEKAEKTKSKSKRIQEKEQAEETKSKSEHFMASLVTLVCVCLCLPSISIFRKKKHRCLHRSCFHRYGTHAESNTVSLYWHMGLPARHLYN